MQDEADGSNEYNNFQRGSLNTTKQLIRDLDNIDIIFHIGDICYANGYLSQWDQFTAQVEPIASTIPYMVAKVCCNYFTSIIGAYARLLKYLCGNLGFILAVVTMSVIGQEQVPSMGTWILEENAAC